jgi:hypothetical protein
VAKSKKAKVPILSPENERFMAFFGLIQWTAATIDQGERLKEALEQQLKVLRDAKSDSATLALLKVHTEAHYFAIAANKLLEHRKWAVGFGLCKSVDFSPLNKFSELHIRDLRNMREHVVDYFKGDGRDKDRWIIETPEFKSDASSLVDSLIGGRLDWKLFSAAAKDLLPALLKEPVPYPATSHMGR